KEKEEVSLEWPDVDFALVKDGVKAARFRLPSPVAVTGPNAGRVLVKAFGVGQQGDGFVACAKAGKGEVVAIGESLPFAWMSDAWWKDRRKGKYADAGDNAKLLRWLLVGHKQ